MHRLLSRAFDFDPGKNFDTKGTSLVFNRKMLSPTSSQCSNKQNNKHISENNEMPDNYVTIPYIYTKHFNTVATLFVWKQSSAQIVIFSSNLDHNLTLRKTLQSRFSWKRKK